MNEFSIPLRVYIEDTDAGSIVYYVNYLKFMERARTEFMRSLGYNKAAMSVENGVGDDKVSSAMFVVSFSQVDYVGSAHLDDELQATAVPIKIGKASIVFKQTVSRGEQVLCEGEIKIACVNGKSRAPQAMPDEMFKKIKTLIAV